MEIYNAYESADLNNFIHRDFKFDYINGAIYHENKDLN